MLQIFLYPSLYISSLRTELPAPTLRIFPLGLTNWEIISLRLAQSWYQSNSLRFLTWQQCTLRIFFPRKFVCRSDCSFRSTSTKIITYCNTIFKFRQTEKINNNHFLLNIFSMKRNHLLFYCFLYSK